MVVKKDEIIKDIILGAGERLYVYAGAVVDNIVVGSGAVMVIYEGGSASNVTVNANGTLVKYDDVSISGLTNNGNIIDAVTQEYYGDGAMFAGISAESTMVKTYGAICTSTNLSFGNNVCFINNNAENDSFAYGGILYNDAGKISIGNDALFSGNSVVAGTWGYGGAVYSENSSVTVGDNAEFTGNSVSGIEAASMYGGAIYSYKSVISVGHDADFVNNSVMARNSYGGVVHCDGGTVSIGHRALFSKNSVVAQSSGYGGAVNVENSSITVGNNAEFTCNTIKSSGTRAWGGAINSYNSYIVVGSDASFVNNSVAANTYAWGGAVHCDGGTVSIGANVAFTGNSTVSKESSACGGAISNVGSSVTIGSNAYFDNNNVDGTRALGGAIENSIGTVTIGDGAVFTGNSATAKGFVYGGAIYNNLNANVSVGANAVFTGNSTVSKESSACGGAIYNIGTMTIGNGALFSGNSAEEGGAIFNTGTISMGNVVFAASSDTIYNSGTITVNGNVSFAGDVTLVWDSSLRSSGNIDLNITGRSLDDGTLINDWSCVKGYGSVSVTVSTAQEYGEYTLLGEADDFKGVITVKDQYGNNRGTLSVNGNNLVLLDKSAVALRLDEASNKLLLEVISLSADGISWAAVPGVSEYIVEYSTDDFASVLRFETEENEIDTYGLPQGDYQWQVGSDAGVLYKGKAMVVAGASGPQQLTSDDDGNMDLFFAEGKGVWQAFFKAEYQGNNGISATASVDGKNKITDVFVGSEDANVLVMTDDSCGDALFLDDVYSAFGDSARLSQIKEIRAGAGDDLIDLTSNKYDFDSEQITVYGGAGNDTIWAESGSNIIYGDAGNDIIIGGADDDIIIGGSGNDILHGGGGKDVFFFGGDWGVDTVEQCVNGSLTLYFEETGGVWDENTFTYTCGENKVTVVGTSEVRVLYGVPVDTPENVFSEFVTENIFEKTENVLA